MVWLTSADLTPCSTGSPKHTAGLAFWWSLALSSKSGPSTLPHHPNIHYLSGKSYQEFASAAWDVAFAFVCNESARFHPAGLKRQSIWRRNRQLSPRRFRDVVRPYGEQGLVQIADTVSEFCDGDRSSLESNSNQFGLAGSWCLFGANLLGFYLVWTNCWNRDREAQPERTSKLKGTRQPVPSQSMLTNWRS